MNKRVFISFLITICYLTAFCQPQSSFYIDGYLQGRDTGHLIFSYTDYFEKRVTDTVIVKNGIFFLTGFINAPTFISVKGRVKTRSVNDKNYCSFFIEPTKMQLTLYENNFKRLKVRGSKTQDEADSLNGQLAEINKITKPLSDEADSLRILLKANKDDSLKILEINKRIDTIYKIFAVKKEDTKKIKLNYAATHNYSIISPYELLVYIDGMSLDSARMFYNFWDDNVKNSKEGKLIAQSIAIKETNSIGGIAPNFTFETIYNKTINLSDFKGKQIVLIDFWASWCIPCREAFSELKKIYAKYNRKELAIIAVTIDEDLQAWRNAIQQDGIGQWYHTTATKQPKVKTEDDIIEKYETNGIPTQYLIDKNGKIIGRWFGYTEANEKELRKLIGENLK
ncbi:MAG: AhpC/TSA family protein [Bacteroidetes bacterium]|nr:AhpC/TSA family protein [Bacteroidota bacterium]